MKRRLILPIILIVLIASAITPFVLTVQASAGCSAVAGLSGPYFETQTRSSGALAFSAGDTIKVSVTGPGNSGSTTARLAVSGPAGFDQTSASSLSFTIPSDGKYDVTVGNASMEDLNGITVSCGSAGGAGGSPWSGFTDGRLSPDMAENFSLWCIRDNLDVYRAPKGIGEFIVSVPLSKIVGLKPEKIITVKTKLGALTIRRDKNNVFYVEGNIGTNAPAFASKYFKIEECFKANGAVVKPVSTSVPSKPTLTPVPLKPTSTPLPPKPTNTPVSAPTLTPIPDDNQLVGNLVTLLNELGPVDPSKDRDGDGVRNTLDLCPDDPNPGLAFGCPDSDGDKLSDPVDDCPNVFGALRGCPDTDGDGVSSRYDLCPNFAPPAGSSSSYGCPDADGDGYPNITDWCPFRSVQDTPGIPLFMGCPDPDGDGFLSSDFPLVPAGYYDDCPRYPLPWDAASGPCPDTTTLAPVTPSVPLQIFAYAAQVGAYSGLVVQTEEIESTCVTGSYGFCGLFN